MTAAQLRTRSAKDGGADPRWLHAVLEGKGREGKGRDSLSPIHDLPRQATNPAPLAPMAAPRPWMALRAVVGGGRG